MYALGITFHELLTGKPPFQAESLRELHTLHLTAPRPQIAADRAPWRLRQLIVEMMDPEPQKRPWTYEELLARLEAARPKPALAGGVVARGMALAVDLAVLTTVGELLSGAVGLGTHLAHQLALLVFGTYYIVTHRLWGRSLGKRLLGLRIQGTKRAVSVGRLTLRFLVEFWGPITAAIVLTWPGRGVHDLQAISSQIEALIGMDQLPLHDSFHALLDTVFIPNLVLAIPWLAGFVLAFIDDDRQTLHDLAARTRVVYELRR
jgi:uncharacterized RDD family membrane protein YckC